MRWVVVLAALTAVAFADNCCETVPCSGSWIGSVEFAVQTLGRFSSSDVFDLQAVGPVAKLDGSVAVQVGTDPVYATIDLPIRYTDRALVAKLKDDENVFALVQASLANPDVADLQADITKAKLVFKGKLRKGVASGTGKITFKGIVTAGPAQGKPIKGRIVLSRKLLSLF